MDSASGLITRQIISQLGGLRGASVFKIPGVRRLLKTFGPKDAFTADAAFQLIGGKDPDNASSSFKEFEDDLYIEQREIGTKLRLVTSSRISLTKACSEWVRS
jgi:hypothetical protein